MTTLHLESALLPDGWANNVSVTVNSDGTIGHISKGSDPQGSQVIPGAALPGMPNLHSHAFQRAMAGLGEISGPARDTGEPDSFWTWRQNMYGFLHSLTPDHIEAIAFKLYVDMLKAGYTSVAEFHYVHHNPDGTPYDDRAETSRRTLAAARNAGIGITHLPVLYNHGGFGGLAPTDGQRRFLNNADEFMQIVSALHADSADDPQACVGIAPHSLRAVTPELLSDVIGTLNGFDTKAPIHIHIAEQTKEVDDCLAWSGQRPVEWLLDHQTVDDRWCLIHATHMTDGETDAMAKSGAVAGLCPATEANLGDGIFSAARFAAQGGIWGIGSDSHISVNVKEELRWLEYGQRLIHRQRTMLAGGAECSTGRALYESALKGGTRACARPIGAIEEGRRADLFVLNTEKMPLAGLSGDALLDAWLFACDTNPISDVFVGGKQVISDGFHVREDKAEAGMRAVMESLTATQAFTRG